MKIVQVLGAGCPKCAKLFENAQKAAADAGIPAKVEKVSDMDVITEFGVIATPALVIDGEVKAVGRLLTPDEIKRLLAVAS
jgi:small redox-active disulfide protein 2